MSEIKTLTVNGRSYTVADPDAAHIDDTAVGEKAWSSRRIMEAVDQADSSAAIVCRATGSAIAVSDASDRPLRGLTVYGKTTQTGTPAPENPVALESVGDNGSIGVRVYGKNLLPYPFATGNYSYNGVTFTDNGDGSITVNGTATGGIYYALCFNYALRAGVSYTLSGCPAGGGTDTYSVYAEHDTGSATNFWEHDTGNGKTLSFPNGAAGKFYIRVASGAVLSNLVFKPQLERGTVATAYEPYKAQALTVSMPNGLPGIPVSSGGNYTDESGQAWICDEVDFARGVYVQRLYTMQCNGNENWQGATNNQLYIPKQNMPKPHKSNSQAVFSSHFPQGSAAPRCYLGGAWGFTVQTTGAATVEQWKAWLGNNPVDVVYELETPMETPLTSAELAAFAALHSNKPNTTVLNDAGAGMAVAYIADTKLYIDSKLAAISAAMLNM